MRFYYLKQDLYHTYFSSIGPENQADALRCPECGRFISMRRWLPPYRVELELYGREYGDIACGPGNDFLITDRFRRLYDKEGLSGLEGFDPVHIVRAVCREKHAPNQTPPSYFRVSVVDSDTLIDQEASGFEWTEPPTCSTCRIGEGFMRCQRVVIDPETWDGRDIFYPRGGIGVFTSQRFKELCQRLKIKSVRLIPAEQYARDWYPGEKYPPWDPRSPHH